MSNDKNVKPVRGEKGFVGVHSPGEAMKARWQAEGGNASLKVFARKLEKDGDETAVAWFANKMGMSNQSRTDANIKRATESRLATKTAKRKLKK